MLQRLQIARTLVTHPRLVFMDEPTGGLDVSVQARLLDLIRSLVARLAIAVVLVTHDIAVARLLAHRIVVMQRGRVVETGLTDQVLDDPQHPYTQLAGQLGAAGMNNVDAAHARRWRKSFTLHLRGGVRMPVLPASSSRCTPANAWCCPARPAPANRP